MLDVSPSKSTVWTLGHSTRPIDEFMRLLSRHNIQTVIDVRRFPGSRKYPQYGKDALADALRRKGVGYEWWEALGGRRKPRADSVNTVWRNTSFRAYADYMATPDFEQALNALCAAAREQGLALMCSEAVWWRCHRSMIADALCVRGLHVEHILDLQHTAAHPMTSPARVVDGVLTYATADNDPGATSNGKECAQPG